MSRKPSTETELRNLKAKYIALSRIRDNVIAQRNSYLARAEKAENELAEWKRRFDLLLEKSTIGA